MSNTKIQKKTYTLANNINTKTQKTCPQLCDPMKRYPYHILHMDQRPLYREAGDGLHKWQYLVPRTGKSTLRLCYYVNNIVRPFGTI